MRKVFLVFQSRILDKNNIWKRKKSEMCVAGKHFSAIKRIVILEFVWERITAHSIQPFAIHIIHAYKYIHIENMEFLLYFHSDDSFQRVNGCGHEYRKCR